MMLNGQSGRISTGSGCDPAGGRQVLEGFAGRGVVDGDRPRTNPVRNTPLGRRPVKKQQTSTAVGDYGGQALGRGGGRPSQARSEPMKTAAYSIELWAHAAIAC